MHEEITLDTKEEVIYATDLANLKVGEVLYVDMTSGGARTGVQNEVVVTATKFDVKTWKTAYKCVLTGRAGHDGAWVRAEYLHLKGEVQDGA